MENFLPALLIVGGVIYKIYSEFRKEQEKARRRVPSIPVPKHIPTPPQTVKTSPARIPVPPKVPTTSTFKSENLPEEVKKAQQQRKEKKLPKIEIETPKLEILAESKVAFDLRQAVIQSVILERPYQ